MVQLPRPCNNAGPLHLSSYYSSSSLFALLLFLAMITTATADGLISFSYPDFSNHTSLSLNSARFVNGTVVLVSHDQGGLTGGQLWYSYPIQVRGFKTTFTYTISDYSGNNQRKDGIAFVIQNVGIDAIGAGGSGLGYGSYGGTSSGIEKSVAVEFDSFYNPELGDPDYFHVSVHSNGVGENSANEAYSKGRSPPGKFQLNNNPISIEITYIPVNSTAGLMNVLVNTLGQVSVNLTLDSYLDLDPTNGSAWVGFTGGHSQYNDSLQGETIQVLDWDFTFLGLIESANCIVSGLDSAEAGANLTFYLQAVDQYGNNMTTDGIEASGKMPLVTFTQPDGNQQDCTIIYSGEGSYTSSLNATVSGNTIVTLTLGGAPLGTSPYTLLVIPSSPVPWYSFPYGSGLDTEFPAGTVGEFWVQLCDQFQNNITADVPALLVATIVSTSSEDGPTQNATIEYDPSGRLRATYNVTKVGTYAITVTLDTVPTNNSEHTLTIVAAPLNPATSVLYTISETVVIAGVQQQAWVQLCDEFSNNVSVSANVTFTAISEGATVLGTVESLGSGLYSITYTPTISGTYTLEPLVNEESITLQTSEITVNPAVIDPATSSVYGDGLLHGIAGEDTSFTLQLKDFYGNNITEQQQGILVIVTIANTNAPPVTPVVSPPENGIYTISYSINKAASYELKVFVNNTLVQNGNNALTISPAAVYPPECYASGSGLGPGLVVGQGHVFEVVLCDQYLNVIPINTSEVLFVQIFDFADPTFVLNTSYYFADEAYQVEYTTTKASIFAVNITINSEAIRNGDMNVTLLPAAIYPLECSATGDLSSDAVAGIPRAFQVQLRDEYANDITDVETPQNIVAATFSLPSGEDVVVDAEYIGVGVYNCTYTPTVTGSYTLFITANGSAIGNAQHSVDVVPAAPDPAHCLAEGTALTNAVAGANSSFYIYILDAFNNSIPSDVGAPAVSISPTSGQQFISVVHNDALGLYVATYNITTSAPGYTVTITVSGDQIATPPSLTVVPAPLYPGNCLSYGLFKNNAIAGQQGQFFVQLRDFFGNNITTNDNVAVDSQMIQALIPPVTPDITPTLDGIYSLAYNITVSGTYVTSVSINGDNILESPFTTNISPSGFDPHGTTVSGVEFEVTAGQLNNFTIQPRDAFGNALTESGIPANRIALLFNQIAIGEVASETDGEFEVSYNCTIAGAYAMNVTVNDEEIGTEPLGTVVVIPDVAYPPACTATGDRVARGFVKKSNTFQLIIRDRYNNVRNGSEELPEVVLSATGEDQVQATLTLQSDGSYLVDYVVPSKVIYSMSIVIGGQNISGSPFSVKTEYGNNSASTMLIVLSVVGGVGAVAIIAVIVYRIYQRRRTYSPI